MGCLTSKLVSSPFDYSENRPWTGMGRTRGLYHYASSGIDLDKFLQMVGAPVSDRCRSWIRRGCSFWRGAGGAVGAEPSQRRDKNRTECK